MNFRGEVFLQYTKHFETLPSLISCAVVPKARLDRLDILGSKFDNGTKVIWSEPFYHGMIFLDIVGKW
jgi:hypothetical protein